MRALVAGLLLGLAAAPAAFASPARGDAGPSVAIERRLSFETARLAIERGEARLAGHLLEDLTAGLTPGTEQALYRALAAKTEGDADAFEQRIGEALATLAEAEPAAVEAPLPWVETEILALASSLRLDKLDRARDRRLAEVLGRHQEALGGLGFARQLESFVAVGTVSGAEGQAGFRLVRARPGLYRLDLATPAGVWSQVADLQAAWRADPRIDGGRPSYLADGESATARRTAAFDGPLVRSLAGGERLLYQGAEAFRGREGHLIELLDAAGGLLESVWLDGETWLEARRRVFAPDGEVVSETTIEHREIEGHPLPARQTVNSATGTLVFDFDTYRLNPQLDPAFFDIGNAAP